MTEKSCSHLASALTSSPSSLRLLEISRNNLLDSGVELLCTVLINQKCKLEELQLVGCKLTEKSCFYMASALTSNSSSLRLLQLSANDLLDSGVELLCSALSHPNCKLEELHMCSCNLTAKSCTFVASSLTSHTSRLRRLDLSGNNLLDSGVKCLCTALCHQSCKLETLDLYKCDLTEKSCSYLASALTSHCSSLRQLDLSFNELLDSGVELLCSGLWHHNCKLETLQLVGCFLTEKSCAFLSCVLSSHSSLRILNLSNNTWSKSGVDQLSALVKDSHCKLEELQMAGHIFRKENPAAATAGYPLCLDTPREDHHIAPPQRSCESCAEVPDSSHWVLVKPELSPEKSISSYSLSSPAGSYECSESGLRWSCAAPVTLHYCFTDWHVFAEELAHMHMSPAGPLMDIRLISGELEEIHLPHFLCLGGSDASVCDAVRVLHGRDDGVCVEECELVRHHARLLQPSLSPLGVIYYLRSLLFPMRVHSKVLVYQSSLSPPSYRSYLLPEDARLEQLVERHEEKFGGVQMDNPHPVTPLQMDSLYNLKTDCPSEINPEELMLRYSKTTPNFCKIELSCISASFHIELFSSADSRIQCVWRAKFQSVDDRQTRPLAESQAATRDSQSVRLPQGPETSRDSSRDTIKVMSGVEGEAINLNTVSAPIRHPSPGQVFFSGHKAALETRLPSVLTSILIPLQQRRVLNDLEREQVENKSTSTERNHVLLSMIQRKGAKAQQVFYEVLKDVDPTLMSDMERTS